MYTTLKKGYRGMILAGEGLNLEADQAMDHKAEANPYK